LNSTQAGNLQEDNDLQKNGRNGEIKRDRKEKDQRPKTLPDRK
jgi:hypothetical protein